MQICFIVKSCLFSVRITSIMADLPQWFNDDFYFWVQKQCEAGKTTEHAKSSTAFGSRYESTPKTATSDRWVSLPTETMQLLRQYRAWQNAERLRLGEYYHDQGFLFAQEDGKSMHPDSITSWLAKFSKRTACRTSTLTHFGIQWPHCSISTASILCRSPRDWGTLRFRQHVIFTAM